MYERLDNCPSCKHSHFENHSICKDYSVSGESFALVKCQNCMLIFTNPRPAPDQLAKFYESDTYISHTDKANSLVNLLYKIVRSYTLRRKRTLIEKHIKEGMILDYGCGTGDFLKECKAAGWSTVGIEPNENARTISKKKTLQTIHPSIDKMKEQEFDVITAWHVVEHIAELRSTLKKLKKRLSTAGHMIIAVPNAHSHDCHEYKDYWAAYDVPRHLYHFTQESLSALAKSLDLKVVDIHPMKFDAFYVSMLSEKYKSGKNRYVRAFLNGLRSNRKASKSGEYSSLIYVLTKKS